MLCSRQWNRSALCVSVRKQLAEKELVCSNLSRKTQDTTDTELLRRHLGFTRAAAGEHFFLKA